MKQQGFSLVEILVVATIIMVLAGIGFVSYSSISRQSRDSRRVADLQNLRSALEFYRSDNDYYPVGNDITYLDTLVTEKYLNSVPSDPKSGNYGYYSLDGTNYQLCATLEDGPAPGSGCNTDIYNFVITPLGEE